LKPEDVESAAGNLDRLLKLRREKGREAFRGEWRRMMAQPAGERS
jgi:hypothetical protein